MRRPGTLVTSVAVIGLCIVGGCSSDETTIGDDVETSDEAAASQHLVEGAPTPLAAGTYRFSVHVDGGVATPEASIDVPAGFDDGASWYVVSHDGNEFLGLWTVGVVYNDRQVDRVWILDVDGRRVVVNAAYSAKSTAKDVEKLSSIVQSLEFVPAAAE